MKPLVPTIRLRVVVCDDADEMRALLRDALEEGGMDVIGEVDNGHDGLRVIRNLQPDVALLDVSMPGLGGLDLIPRVASSAPDTAIVVLSGFGGDRVCSQALELGADRYIVKGEPMETVRGAVRQAGSQRAALSRRRVSW
jgi:DNA-binding NarL/FixJ family response regulator